MTERSESRACAREGCPNRLGPGFRKHAQYCSAICRAEAWRQQHPAPSPQKRTKPFSEPDVHALADARAAQEATKLKDHYSQVIYQGIIERLERGPVHADDLEDLFPDSDRTMCRKLVGAQFGSLASRHYIREKERRKSSIASRKGAKSSVWEFTQKGRERLAGAGTQSPRTSLGADHPGRERALSVGSNETSPTTTGKGQAHAHGATLDRPASSQDDSPVGARLLDDGVGGSSTAPHEAVAEPTALPGLEEKPRSAWTDPELGEAA